MPAASNTLINKPVDSAFVHEDQQDWVAAPCTDVADRHKAITLVHKEALPIALHSIKSFARHFHHTHFLIIHTDASVGKEDRQSLVRAAHGLPATLVTAADRWQRLPEILTPYPGIRAQLDKRGSTFTKLEIPMLEKKPYFFFDSDIIWLRHVQNLKPMNAPNAFSTETWSAYPGIAEPGYWVRKRVPRRVNSGFQYLSGDFPFDRLEALVSNNKFNKALRHAGDQEIFAYLYPDMEYYHPDDFKRSRVGTQYQLSNMECAALHFPGRMWREHLGQIEALEKEGIKSPVQIRFQKPVPLSHIELARMRAQLKLGDSATLRPILNVLRKLLIRYR